MIDDDQKTCILSKQKHMAYQNCNWSMQIIKTKTHGMSKHVIGQCELLQQKHMAI